MDTASKPQYDKEQELFILMLTYRLQTKIVDFAIVNVNVLYISEAFMANIGSVNSLQTTAFGGSLKQSEVKTAQNNLPLSDSFSKSTSIADEELKASILKDLKSSDSRVLDEKTVAFPDNYGRVKHLALQLSNYAYGSIRSDMLNAYKVLFTEMEPDTKFTVVCGSAKDQKDVEKVIKDFNVPNPERIDFIKPEGLNLTVWARDQMISMYFPDGDGSKTALTNQSMLHDWHGDDEAVPQYIAAKHPSIVLDKERRIRTDGGEVVSNRGETFVGAFSIIATAKKLKELASKDSDFANQIKDYAEKEMGMEVKLSELENPLPYDMIPKKELSFDHEQPYFLAENPLYKNERVKAGQATEGDMWIKVAKDLFERQFGQKVTPMGLDDPSTPRVEGPANDHLDMGLTPLDEGTMAVGDPSLAKRVFEQMTSERRKEVAALLSEASGTRVMPEDLLGARGYPNQQQDFNAYATSLEKGGYKVIRMPYAEPGWGTPNISYNNCLMERFHKEDGTEVKRIFLPVYGIKELDSLAISNYEKEGFEVRPMPLANIATRKGALRCMSQWLVREQHNDKYNS